MMMRTAAISGSLMKELSLCEAARFLMTDASEHTTCYQYDGSVSYANVKFPAAANVFTADRDGVLTDVMFPFSSSNPQSGYYIVSVYRLREECQVAHRRRKAVYPAWHGAVRRL